MKGLFDPQRSHNLRVENCCNGKASESTQGILQRHRQIVPARGVSKRTDAAGCGAAQAGTQHPLTQQLKALGSSSRTKRGVCGRGGEGGGGHKALPRRPGQ